jgi:NAD(P)-dependent dehydrogenase (short-subunit alcohol dehydrogenase family)
MSEGFSRRFALATGNSGGLERVASAAFLERGARVVVSYRRQNELGGLRPLALLQVMTEWRCGLGSIPGRR